MKNTFTLIGCFFASYVVVRGLLGTAYDVVNWLLKMLLLTENSDNK
jgi:hypothetical protein